MDTTKEKTQRLSLVVPMYNESDTLEFFFGKVCPILESLEGLNWEIVCVNDGSKDLTLKKLCEFSSREPRIRIVDLSRNFGKDAALTAGLDFARGDAVVPIDADLQDPPELISELVQKWKAGFEVVLAMRVSRQGESVVKRLTANLFYRVIGRLASIPIPQNTGDYRLMDRKVIDAVCTLRESNRFMKGLFSWVGFKTTVVEFHRNPRVGGETKWSYPKLLRFAFDGIIAFSNVPLQIWVGVGAFFAFFAFLYGSFLTIRTLIFGIDVPGYASLMVVVLFLGGIQLLTLGIFGEYIGKIYNESKNRPVYLVRQVFGFTEGMSIIPHIRTSSTNHNANF